MIIEVTSTSDGAELGDIRDKDTGYLTYFSLYLAGLVLFRLIFSLMYILKWKCRYTCSKKYKVKQQNLLHEFKQIKKTSKDGESTDDEEMEEEIAKLYEQNREGIDQSTRRDISRRELHDATVDYIAKKDLHDNESDEDYDFKEFEGAEVEEAEDRIYSVYKMRQKAGEAIDPDEMAELAGDIPIQDMNESVVMSALQGRFEQSRKTNAREFNSMLDISAMME